MTSSSRSFVVVSALVAAWTLLVVARLLQLQVYRHDSFVRQARRQQERTIEVSPVRGVIYDRNYHPLAMSVQVDSIFAVPGEIPNPRDTAKMLSPILGISEAELQRRLKSGRFFSWIKRKVSDREAKRVRQLNLQGIYTQKENKRFYPKRELAAHVLGYVGMDDHGLAGLELSYESSIRGRPAQLVIETDAKQRWRGREGRPPEPGQNLVLTLDENIQYIAERELAAAVNQFRPLSATVIVQEPHTGEILAMANQPTFNPNRYSDFPPDSLRNPAVAASYEPGSTFKIVTVASALEEKLTEPGERIDCQMGAIVLAGHVIHDHHKYGVLTVNEIMQNSSGVGVIKLALRLGNENMYRYMQAFGFGAPTGIELPGEARGLTKPPERWSKISIGAIAMGQEVGVTSLQIVSIASAAANGGWWMRPTIVREQFRKARSSMPPAPRKVMSEETAAAIRKMLTMVVTSGTAKTAQLNGYTAAGKTGTAQKIDPRTGTYSKRDYVASYVGFAPAESPMFTILVAVDSPRGKIYGGEVAAPVFKRIAEQILAYRNVPPSLPVKPALRQAAWTGQRQPAPADFAAELPSSDWNDAEALDGSGAAMLSIDSGVAAPNFISKTARSVAGESQLQGVPVRLIGSGLAYHQSPEPGSLLRVDQKITVWFKVGSAAGLAQAQQSTGVQAQTANRPKEDQPTDQGAITAPKRQDNPWTSPGIHKTGGATQRSVRPAGVTPIAAPG
ncbi:MAG: penicillin-binding protein [Acidobacteria bacterium]|nr:penicillin-binding protein [Acidobacteriota bacterium]